MPQALASSVGIKIATYPADTLKQNVVLGMQAKQREIKANIARMQREYSKKGITREQLDQGMVREQAKLRGVQLETREKLRAAQ